MVKDEHVAHIVFAGVGLTGGVARYLNDMQDGKVKFTFVGLFTFVFISGFFGQMGGLALINLGYGDWAYFGAGIIGFMGSQASAMFIRLVTGFFPNTRAIRKATEDELRPITKKIE